MLKRRLKSGRRPSSSRSKTSTQHEPLHSSDSILVRSISNVSHTPGLGAAPCSTGGGDFTRAVSTSLHPAHQHQTTVSRRSFSLATHQKRQDPVFPQSKRQRPEPSNTEKQQLRDLVELFSPENTDAHPSLRVAAEYIKQGDWAKATDAISIATKALEMELDEPSPLFDLSPPSQKQEQPSSRFAQPRASNNTDPQHHKHMGSHRQQPSFETDEAATRARKAFSPQSKTPTTSQMVSQQIPRREDVDFKYTKFDLDARIGAAMLKELHRFSNMSRDEKRIHADNPIRGALTLLTPDVAKQIQKEYDFTNPMDVSAYVKRFHGRSAVEVDHPFNISRLEYEQLERNYAQEKMKNDDILAIDEILGYKKNLIAGTIEWDGEPTNPEQSMQTASISATANKQKEAEETALRSILGKIKGLNTQADSSVRDAFDSWKHDASHKSGLTGIYKEMAQTEDEGSPNKTSPEARNELYRLQYEEKLDDNFLALLRARQIAMRMGHTADTDWIAQKGRDIYQIMKRLRNTSPVDKENSPYRLIHLNPEQRAHQSWQRIQQQYEALYERHLPKLSQADLLDDIMLASDSDDDHNTRTLIPNIDRIEAQIESDARIQTINEEFRKQQEESRLNYSRLLEKSRAITQIEKQIDQQPDSSSPSQETTSMSLLERVRRRKASGTAQPKSDQFDAKEASQDNPLHAKRLQEEIQQSQEQEQQRIKEQEQQIADERRRIHEEEQQKLKQQQQQQQQLAAEQERIQEQQLAAQQTRIQEQQLAAEQKRIQEQQLAAEQKRIQEQQQEQEQEQKRLELERQRHIEEAHRLVQEELHQLEEEQRKFEEQHKLKQQQQLTTEQKRIQEQQEQEQEQEPQVDQSSQKGSLFSQLPRKHVPIHLLQPKKLSLTSLAQEVAIPNKLPTSTKTGGKLSSIADQMKAQEQMNQQLYSTITQFRTMVGLPEDFTLRNRDIVSSIKILSDEDADDFFHMLFSTTAMASDQEKPNPVVTNLRNLKETNRAAYLTMISLLHQHGGKHLLAIQDKVTDLRNRIEHGDIKSPQDFYIEIGKIGLPEHIAKSINVKQLFQDRELKQLGDDDGGSLANDEAPTVNIIDPIDESVTRGAKLYENKESDLSLVAAVNRKRRSRIFNNLDEEVDAQIVQEIQQGKGIFKALTEAKVEKDLLKHFSVADADKSIPDRYSVPETQGEQHSDDHSTRFDNFFQPIQRAPTRALIPVPAVMKSFDALTIKDSSELTPEHVESINNTIKQRVTRLVERVSRHTLLSPALVLQKMENPIEFGRLISLLTPDMVAEMRMVDNLLSKPQQGQNPSDLLLAKAKFLDAEKIDSVDQLTFEHIESFLPDIKQDIDQTIEEAKGNHSIVFEEDTKRDYLLGHLTSKQSTVEIPDFSQKDFVEQQDSLLEHINQTMREKDTVLADKLLVKSGTTIHGQRRSLLTDSILEKHHPMSAKRKWQLARMKLKEEEENLVLIMEARRKFEETASKLEQLLEAGQSLDSIKQTHPDLVEHVDRLEVEFKQLVNRMGEPPKEGRSIGLSQIVADVSDDKASGADTKALSEVLNPEHIAQSTGMPLDLVRENHTSLLTLFQDRDVAKFTGSEKNVKLSNYIGKIGNEGVKSFLNRLDDMMVDHIDNPNRGVATSIIGQGTEMGRHIRDVMDELDLNQLPEETREYVLQSRDELKTVFETLRSMEVMLDRQLRLIEIEKQKEEMGLPDMKELNLLRYKFDVVINALQLPDISDAKRDKLLEDARSVMAHMIAVRSLRESDPEIYYWRLFLAKIPPELHKKAISCHGLPMNPMRLFEDLNPSGSLTLEDTKAEVIRFIEEKAKETRYLQRHVELRASNIHPGSPTMTLRDLRKEQTACRRLVQLQQGIDRMKMTAKQIVKKDVSDQYLHQLRMLRLNEIMQSADPLEVERRRMEHWLDTSHLQGRKAVVNALIQDVKDMESIPVSRQQVVANKKLLKRLKRQVDIPQTSRMFSNDRLNPVNRQEHNLKQRTANKKVDQALSREEAALTLQQQAFVAATRENERLITYLGQRGVGSHNLHEELRREQQLELKKTESTDVINVDNVHEHVDQSTHVVTQKTQFDRSVHVRHDQQDTSLVTICNQPYVYGRVVAAFGQTVIVEQVGNNAYAKHSQFYAGDEVDKIRRAAGDMDAQLDNLDNLDEFASSDFDNASSTLHEDTSKQTKSEKLRHADSPAHGATARDNEEASGDFRNSDPTDTASRSSQTEEKAAPPEDIFERRAKVIPRDRKRWHCIKSRHMDLLCGDYVFIDPSPARPWASTNSTSSTAVDATGDDTHGLVRAVFRRHNQLDRGQKSPNKELMVDDANPLIANADHLVIIAAAEGQPPFSTYLVDRYLATAEFSNIKCTIVMNKVDLINVVQEAESVLAKLKAKRATTQDREKTLRKKLGKRELTRLRRRIAKEQRKQLKNIHFYTTNMQKFQSKQIYNEALARELQKMEEDGQYEQLMNNKRDMFNTTASDVYDTDDEGRIYYKSSSSSDDSRRQRSSVHTDSELSSSQQEEHTDSDSDTSGSESDTVDHQSSSSLQKANSHLIVRRAPFTKLDYVYDDEEFNEDLENRILLEQQIEKWIRKKKRQHADDVEKTLLEYESLGINVIRTSTKTGQGIDQLRDILSRFHTTAFVGPSGVGKSSLLNALIPNIEAQTSGMTVDGKGQHTTTSSRMYHLPAGGSIIDTPGSSSFLPPPLEPDAVSSLFPEIRAVQKYCKLGDSCKHLSEVGCAVREAIGDGREVVIPVTLGELFDPNMTDNNRVREFRRRLEDGELRQISKNPGNNPVLLYAQRFYRDLDNKLIQVENLSNHIPTETVWDLGGTHEIEGMNETLMYAEEAQILSEAYDSDVNRTRRIINQEQQRMEFQTPHSESETNIDSSFESDSTDEESSLAKSTSSFDDVHAPQRADNDEIRDHQQLDAQQQPSQSSSSSPPSVDYKTLQKQRKKKREQDEEDFEESVNLLRSSPLRKENVNTHRYSEHETRRRERDKKIAAHRFSSHLPANSNIFIPAFRYDSYVKLTQLMTETKAKLKQRKKKSLTRQEEKKIQWREQQEVLREKREIRQRRLEIEKSPLDGGLSASYKLIESDPTHQSVSGAAQREFRDDVKSLFKDDAVRDRDAETQEKVMEYIQGMREITSSNPDDFRHPRATNLRPTMAELERIRNKAEVVDRLSDRVYTDSRIFDKKPRLDFEEPSYKQLQSNAYDYDDEFIGDEHHLTKM